MVTVSPEEPEAAAEVPAGRSPRLAGRCFVNALKHLTSTSRNGNRGPAWVLKGRGEHERGDVKNELERVRELTRARIKSGDVPDWSWHHHVQLIETIDALLHDISVMADSSKPLQRAGGTLRVVTGNAGARGHASSDAKLPERRVTWISH